MDESKLQAFTGQVLTDMAAASSGVMTGIGHKLGLYKAMAGSGAMTPAQLASRTGCAERYLREWLNNQAAGGYVVYDAETETYQLPDEHAMVLANPDSPVFLAPGVDVIRSMWMDEELTLEAFRTGQGVDWGAHSGCLFCGAEAFFRTGYKAHLVAEWLPALGDMVPRLEAGVKVADVGCGHGASTIIMAQAFPNSRFYGFDYHAPSIETARERAREAGVSDRVNFEVADAKSYPGNDYAMICFMDCLHDMGDPVGAAAYARQALDEDGRVLLIEPAAGDSPEENLHAVGRMYYAASTAICTAHSLSQEVGLALGAQAGERRLGEVMKEAGFGQFRCAAKTPFNLVLEAR